MLNRIQSLRAGKMNDTRFGTRMSGEGIFAVQIENIFQVTCRKAGMNEDDLELSVDSFRRPISDQLTLFD